jgi:Cu(I)/Ag(I) efflux system membrane fusion protein
VRFSSEAHPGTRHEGKIAFIDPAVDDATRTVKVRVNVPNADGALKPGMFVRGVVQSRVATAGRVLDPALAGKWISPMHPEIVKDGPGACDVCGMALVRAEDLGYVAAAAGPEDMPLVVPASAPLRTGRRAVVYVEVPGAEQPTYEGREVLLGPRAGDHFIVEKGLAEGERVVTRGAFKIDSELQIQARPSMMSLPSEAPDADTDPVPPEFLEALANLLDGHFAIQQALAGDDGDAAGAAVHAADPVLRAVPKDTLAARDLRAWESIHAPALHGALADLHAATELESLRAAFEGWDAALRAALAAFGLPEERKAFVVHCPMAFDFRGADWLQADESVLNPYFGAEMLRCGTVQGPLSTRGGH